MTDKLVPLSLIDEYGLAEPHFKILRLARQGPIQWPDQRLQEITRQPAGALRKLVDRGLIAGPERRLPIRAKPFTITPAGSETLRKIEAGLHRPAWLSEGKVKVLELPENKRMFQHEILRAGGNMMSFSSLAQGRYLDLHQPGGVWGISELGQEAPAEWRREKGGDGDQAKS